MDFCNIVHFPTCNTMDFCFATFYIFILQQTILDTLICSIEAVEKGNPQKSINLNISAAQFSDLISCIFDFTKRLAEANNFNTNSINRPKYFKKKTSDDLKYYLNMQKQIFEQAA